MNLINTMIVFRISVTNESIAEETQAIALAGNAARVHPNI